MPTKIRVSILDDHQGIIDGYLYRLNKNPEIEVVATANFGEDVDPLLASHPTDVLILDVQVTTSPDNFNPYPILHLIPKVLQTYPDLSVLVISMHNQPTIIKAVMDAGASGYIFKDDIETIQELGNVIQAVDKGGIHLSQHAYRQLFKKLPKESTPTRRQLEALSLCASHPDVTTAELANRLGIANSTMRNLLSDAYLRLDVRNKTSAIAKARQLGLITPEIPTVEF
jgi:two-component system, NarL family, nitrate/nitrite response regulator NarL